jgi:hypothetical protein
MGDFVDGLYTLQNGTQRWYAGKITAVNDDGTYSVTYNDGEVCTNKSVVEIRGTKSRANSRAGSRAGSAMNTARTTSQSRISSDMGGGGGGGGGGGSVNTGSPHRVIRTTSFARRGSSDTHTPNSAHDHQLQLQHQIQHQSPVQAGMTGMPVVMTAANILRQKFATSNAAALSERRASRGSQGGLTDRSSYMVPEEPSENHHDQGHDHHDQEQSELDSAKSIEGLPSLSQSLPLPLPSSHSKSQHQSQSQPQLQSQSQPPPSQFQLVSEEVQKNVAMAAEILIAEVNKGNISMKTEEADATNRTRSSLGSSFSDGEGGGEQGGARGGEQGGAGGGAPKETGVQLGREGHPILAAAAAMLSAAGSTAPSTRASVMMLPKPVGAPPVIVPTIDFGSRFKASGAEVGAKGGGGGGIGASSSMSGGPGSGSTPPGSAPTSNPLTPTSLSTSSFKNQHQHQHQHQSSSSSSSSTTNTNEDKNRREHKPPSSIVLPLRLSLINNKSIYGRDLTRLKEEAENENENDNEDGKDSARTSKSAKSNDTEDSDNIFEIPSVFGTARTPSTAYDGAYNVYIYLLIIL